MGRLEPARMKTYSVASPQDTHTRAARCEEVDCAAQAGGWETLVNESTTLGERQAHYIRTMAGRSFTESRAAGVTTFRFPPGEQCFADHRVSLDRPEFYIVRDGDHRGNPTGRTMTHSGPDPWLNDFGDHLHDLSTTIDG
jgi:hypothetical protein